MADDPISDLRRRAIALERRAADILAQVRRLEQLADDLERRGEDLARENARLLALVAELRNRIFVLGGSAVTTSDDGGAW